MRVRTERSLNMTHTQTHASVQMLIRLAFKRAAEWRGHWHTLWCAAIAAPNDRCGACDLGQPRQRAACSWCSAAAELILSARRRCRQLICWADLSVRRARRARRCCCEGVLRRCGEISGCGMARGEPEARAAPWADLARTVRDRDERFGLIPTSLTVVWFWVPLKPDYRTVYMYLMR